MSDFSENDPDFGPDPDLFANRWRNFGPPRDGYYPPPLGGSNRILHVKTTGSCAARDNTTGAMSSVSCALYRVNADGTVTDLSTTVTVWNPGGTVDSGKWATIMLNEAGQYEFVVVKCS